METIDFNYNLPESLIAQFPAEPRDSSRLMVVDKDVKSVEHKYFFDIIDYLGEGDVLVVNNSKVFKARLHGKVFVDEKVEIRPRRTRLGQEKEARVLNAPEVEIFLIRPMENFGVWKVLAKPGRKLRPGMKIVFLPSQANLLKTDEEFSAEVVVKESDGTVLLQFNEDDVGVRTRANIYGEVPTPPYIHIENNKIKNLDEKYQTVYAKPEGSVAAPTAGFHFTPELLDKLKDKGVLFTEVTLHVGLGTFLPVKTEKIEEHKMHSEWVELTAKNVDIINKAKKDGRRVVAVGTTTARSLEGIVEKNNGELKPFTGDINIFITPGFKFKILDALITNFHLPKSTLLMLVSAFADDREFILECYKQAVEESYRFYSFGDAMLIK